MMVDDLDELMPLPTRFSSFKPVAPSMVTTLDKPFYPDYLEDALVLYAPVFRRFEELCGSAPTGTKLLADILDEPAEGRIQLLRVFRKYVSPTTSVEMLKRKAKMNEVIEHFGAGFRDMDSVRAHLAVRDNRDEALAAVLWEHHDRGTAGYVLTERFFDMFEARFQDDFAIVGPRTAGPDIQLRQVLSRFEEEVPADFLILRRRDRQPLVVGFAHYDSDRGGSQEDDRTGGNQDKVKKIMQYAARRRLPLRVLFVNDGPGLLLGSMWDDYARLEEANIVDDELRVMVLTLKMFEARLDESWIMGV